MKKSLRNTLRLLFGSALVLVFGFSVMAQSKAEKPLDARALAALVKELKEVVAKSGAEEKEAAQVAAKWDQRKDLAGKTKEDVINLLFQDVKAVIKDSGVHYQINSMFAFYKRIPEESSPAQPRIIKATSKPAAVEGLTLLTYAMHPYVGIDEELAGLPGTKDIKAEEERVRKGRVEGFEEALKVNNKLTPEQKTFVRANYDELIKIVDKITEEAINKNFPTQQWIMEGLDRSFAAKFSLKELNDLIVFFDADQGQQVLKYVRQTKLAELITGNGGKLDITPADKAVHDKFIATPLGKRFMMAYIDEAQAYEQQKENAVRSKNPDADGFAIYQPENLNKLFNKFVAENYKK